MSTLGDVLSNNPLRFTVALKAKKTRRGFSISRNRATSYWKQIASERLGPVRETRLCLADIIPSRLAKCSSVRSDIRSDHLGDTAKSVPDMSSSCQGLGFSPDFAMGDFTQWVWSQAHSPSRCYRGGR